VSTLHPANANVDASEAADVPEAAGAEVLRLPSSPAPRVIEHGEHAEHVEQVEQADVAERVDLAGAATLYHFPTSLYSQQVRLTLAEKGVEWDGQIINIGPAHEHFAPWYAKLNPRLVVPTLEVAGTVVTDSTQIIRYIDQRFPGPALMPTDPAARAQALLWLEREAELPMRELGYARTKGITRWLQRWSLRQRRKQLIKLRSRHVEFAEVYTAKLEDLDALEQAIKSRTAMGDLVDRVELLLDDLEATLSEQRWLAGDQYSLADLVWTAVIAKLEHIGFARSIGQHRRPRVREWYTRLRERPSWGAMIRRLTPWQVARFYGPAAIRAFLIFWVLKWALVGGGVWLIKHLVAG
jgi:glutathione S-transferase